MASTDRHSRARSDRPQRSAGQTSSSTDQRRQPKRRAREHRLDVISIAHERERESVARHPSTSQIAWTSEMTLNQQPRLAPARDRVGASQHAHLEENTVDDLAPSSRIGAQHVDELGDEALGPSLDLLKRVSLNRHANNAQKHGQNNQQPKTTVITAERSTTTASPMMRKNADVNHVVAHGQNPADRVAAR